MKFLSVKFLSIKFWAAKSLLLIGFAFSICAQAQLTNIVIDHGADSPKRIAIVPFAYSGPKMPEDIPAIMRNDLNFSGQFESIAEDRMITYPQRESEIRYRDWKMINAEYIVLGNTTYQTGRFVTTFELYDVNLQRKIMTATSVEGSELQLRDMAHRISDAVYQTITGIRGIFSTKIVYVEAFQKPARYRLMLSDVDGARSRVLLDSKQPILSPVWSPDGQRVAYVSFETDRPAIYLQDINSNRREQMTNFKGLNGAPAFSPDGQYLAMCLSKDGSPDIYTMNIATHDLKRVASSLYIDTEPSWSADGSAIYFTSDRGGKPQIYKVTIATAMTERVTFDGDYNTRGRMAPDGRNLVMVHQNGPVFDIAAMDLKTQNFRILSETNYDESPTIAPNGAMLMYATSYGGKGILAVVSLDAKTKVRLPSKLGDVREPAWSPFF